MGGAVLDQLARGPAIIRELIYEMPPDLRKPATACPFAPRCPYVIDHCLQEIPPLRTVGSNHTSACWRAEELRKIHNFGEQL